MSRAEAARVPAGLHAMVDSGGRAAALTKMSWAQCRECGHRESAPFVSWEEADALAEAREWMLSAGEVPPS